MPLEDELLALERRLWMEGSGAYRDLLADDALLVVPYETLDKERTIAEIEAAPRWDDVTVEDVRLVELGDGAVVTYRAVGRQGDDVVYPALVSSTYARRDGAWLLVHHHQTPMPEGAP